MAEKNDDMDLDEIRKMIGTGGNENQEFSLDDIINEVHDEEKKETIKKRKKEEEEDPFLFLMHETGSIDAAAEQEKKVPAVKPEEKTESEAPGETEAPQEIKARDDQATAEANPVAAEKTAEAKKLPDTFITGEPEAPEEFGEPEEPEKRPEKKKKARAALPPADFDRTDFETPEQATAYLKKREVSQYLRSVLALLAGLLSAYLTLSPTFALPLPFSFSYIETPYLFIFSLIAILIFCMLISLELIAAGFFRLFTGHPTQYSLVSLSTLASLIHAFTIIVFPKWGGYIPFSSLSCILIFFMLFSSAQKKGALRRSIKAQTLSSEPISVKTEKRNAKKICAYREYGKNSDLFTNALKATDPVERFSALYAPCAIVASVVFAAVATAGQGRPELFFWAFSGIITVATPWGLFIAYSAPAKTISKKLLTFGAGISGWDFVRDISQCRYTVLTDSDIYPPQNIRITGVKVFEPYNTEKVLYYAGSVIAESETGLKKVFLDLMREQYIKQGNVSELKFFDSGGISADVNGDHILIGSPMFLLRMGVRIGEGVRIKNGVFVAVNVSLAGIFAMKYEASETVQSAFRLLRRFKVSPIAAVRDFNLTPGLLENKFKLKSQWFEYPEINDRLLLSEPLIGDGSNAAAVMTRDGIVPLSECLAAGKKFYRAVRSNIVVGALSGVIGMLLMFFLAFRAAVTAATPYNTGIYLFLWLIPIMLTSFGSSRY